jgi:hypothetical protein
LTRPSDWCLNPRQPPRQSPPPFTFEIIECKQVASPFTARPEIKTSNAGEGGRFVNIVFMNVKEIMQQLRDERSKLDAAIQALEGVGGGSAPAKRRGRPPVKRPIMSAAARKRIAEAMRKRWAAAKRSGKQRL